MANSVKCLFVAITLAPLLLQEENAFGRTALERWAGFNVGSSVVFRSTMTIAEKVVDTHEFVNTVTKVTKDEVYVYSDEHKGRPTDQKFTNVIVGTDPATVKAPKVESIKVGSEEFKCSIM